MTPDDEVRYAELLRENRPHVIKTEVENEAALAEVELLLSRQDALNPAEEAYLALLALLIEKFEEDAYRLTAANSSEILRKLMSARGMTQTELSQLFPSKGIASEVLAGKREVSKAQARVLGNYFHVAPALFLDL